VIGGRDGAVAEAATSAGPPEAPAPGGALSHLASRLRRNTTLLTGFGFLAAFVGVSVAAVVHFGGALDTPPSDPALVIGTAAPSGPTLAHPFGTDPGLGVDILSSLWRATPNDLVLVGSILLIASVVGLLLGAWAGLVGGWIDLVALAAADLLVGVPPFFLAVVLFLGVGPLYPTSDALPIFVLLFAFVLWPYYARPVRAVAQRTAAQPYVESARAAGADTEQVLFRHILPNSLYPVLAQLPIDVFNVFFVLSVYPYVGCFSPQLIQPIAITPYPTYPEYGALLGYGACFGWQPIAAVDAWWSYVFPAAVILAFGLMVVLLCDGLERHFGFIARR